MCEEQVSLGVDRHGVADDHLPPAPGEVETNAVLAEGVEAWPSLGVLREDVPPEEVLSTEPAPGGEALDRPEGRAESSVDEPGSQLPRISSNPPLPKGSRDDESEEVVGGGVDEDPGQRSPADVDGGVGKLGSLVLPSGRLLLPRPQVGLLEAQQRPQTHQSRGAPVRRVRQLLVRRVRGLLPALLIHSPPLREEGFGVPHQTGQRRIRGCCGGEFDGATASGQ